MSTVNPEVTGRLQPGEKRVFRSAPVMRTALILSALLVFATLFGWSMLDAQTKSQFTTPQVATLLFFLVMMVGLMVSVGLSVAVATPEGLKVRNGLSTKRYAWDRIEGIGLGSGDAWANLSLAPSDVHPEGETVMLLAIQRAEGSEVANERAAELRDLVRANRTA